MLYADEDRLTSDGKQVTPYFKPEWSPESLLAWMYTSRPGVYRTSLVRDLGGFRAEFEPAYEYDLVLRMAARAPKVRRVADILYHRRKSSSSSGPADEAARRAIQNHLNQTGQTATVVAGPAPGLHQTRFALRGDPTVSIVIASACRRVRVRGERTYYLLKCLESIKKTTWSRYEIVVLHGRQVPAPIASELKHAEIVHAAYESPFNWSEAMNRGAALAQGDHLLFLNDDIEVITPDWLERLLEFSQQSAVGAVGAKLFFPSGRIQHAGVAVLDGRPRHPFYSHHGEHPGYFNNLLVPRNCSAVTGACLMTRADVFREGGGFDEALPLNYNDVDYCLRLVASGRRVVCTPYARLYHHELGTRPAEVRPEETAALQHRWGKAWANDPYYNPHLSPSHFDYRIRPVMGESASRHGTE
jgi:GT2 family glycosyltransferase